MTISKVDTKGGRAYRVRVELPPDPETGRRRWHSETFRTKREAEAREAELRQVVRGGVREVGTRRLGSYLVDDWLPHYRAVVKPSTWYVRQSVVLSCLVPELGHLRLADVTPLVLDRWMAGMVDRGMAVGTVRAYHATLGVALAQAERWGLVERNAARLVRPPAARAPHLETWEPGEVAAILEAEDDAGWRGVWAALALTGLRVGELAALRWDDVDLEGMALRVRRTATKDFEGRRTMGPPKSARSEREVRFGPELAAVLRRQRAMQAERRLAHGAWEDGGWAWDRGDGRELSLRQLAERWRRAVDRAGLGYRPPHSLRHYHVTQLAAAGVPVAVIAQRVGHTSVAYLLRTYGHVTAAHQDSAVAAIEGRLGAG